MSERLNFKDQVEFLETEKRIEAHSEQTPDKNEVIGEQQRQAAELNAEAAKQTIEAESDQSQQLLEQINSGAEEQPQASGATTVDKSSLKLMKDRSLKNIRAQENVRERSLSKVIHQPVVRAVSEGAGKTISRPSGLLGGGLIAFLGSGTYLMLAKTIHFEYRYSVSLMLFVAGFFIGLILEMLVHVSRLKHQH